MWQLWWFQPCRADFTKEKANNTQNAIKPPTIHQTNIDDSTSVSATKIQLIYNEEVLRQLIFDSVTLSDRRVHRKTHNKRFVQFFRPISIVPTILTNTEKCFKTRLFHFSKISYRL
ncbi:hypothetical protein ACOME3_004438 [Neoechinorhynchus agilis]